MINEQLLQYIQKQREAGTPDEKIKENLQAAGWKDEDIAEGFEAVSGDPNSPQSHQEMRQSARNGQSEQGNTSQASSKGEQKQASKQKPQKQKQDQAGKTQNNQASQSSGAESRSQDEQPQQQNQDGADDQYREPVEKADTQGAGAAGPAANEDPTPLRTMEEDRQQAQESNTQEPGQTSKAQQSSSSEAKRQQTELSEPHHTAQSSKTTKKESQPDAQSKQPKGKKSATKARPEASKSTSKNQQNKQGKSAKRQPQKQNPQQSQKRAQRGQQQNQPRQSSRAGKSKVGPQSQSAGKRRKTRKQQSRIQQARKQSSSSSIATIILSILGLLVVGGAAAYAYVTYFQSSPASTNAQAVLQSLAESQSFQYRIGISKQTGDSGGLVIEGGVDMNPSTQAQTYYTIRNSTNNTSPVTGLASEFAQYPDLDPRKQQSVQQVFNNQQFLQVGEFQTTQKLGVTENSSGFTTHRFGASISPSRLFSAYSTIHQAIYGQPVDSQLASTLQEKLSNFTPEQGQLWVHPTSSVPYQLTVIGTNANGDDVQVNMQFKNHGQAITSVADTYESKSIAAGLQAYLSNQSNAGGSDIATTTPPESPPSSQPSTTTQSTSSQPDNTHTQSTSSQPDNTQAELKKMRRQDQMRVNDIQQIVVALRVYANDNGQFPSSLSALAGGEVLSALPTDPQTGNRYKYVRISPNRYHVGATLRATSPNQLTSDDNYNSAQSASGGFAGSARVCGTNSSIAGSTCYDRTSTLKQNANSSQSSQSNPANSQANSTQ